jgi:long-chain acyl-CoA synthetase
MTVPQLLELRASELGSAVAVRGVDGDLTYAAWLSEAARLADQLAGDAGVVAGDRVLLWFGNDGAAAYWIAHVALTSIGAIAVPLDDRLSRRDVERLAEEAQPAALICLPRLEAKVLGLRDDDAPPPRDGIDLVVYRVGDDRVGGRAVGTFTIDRDATGRSAQLRQLARAGEIATISFTSGTTGRPKGVVARHSLGYMERVANEFWAVPRGGRPLDADDVVQSPIPVYTASYNVLAAVFAACRAVVEGPRFDPVRSERLMTTERSTVYNGAPAHYIMMTHQEPVPPPADMTLFVVGGSAYSRAAYEQMTARWPAVPIVNWYGLMEVGSTMNFGDDLRANPAAIGRPTEGAEARIVDADGNDVAPGEPGELLLRNGPFEGYYNRPDLTAAKVVDGWFRTGDVAILDERGLIEIQGRSEDRINRGGFKFYPAEIEDAAGEHPDVAEAAVIAVDHPALGQDAVLFVVPKPGRELTVADVREFLQGRIARNKVPSEVLFLSALPRNSYSKVIRRDLSRLYAHRSS